MSCGVSCTHGSDLALLWLWYRPVATTPIRPLVEYAPKKRKKKKKTIASVCEDVEKSEPSTLPSECENSLAGPQKVKNTITM